MPVHAQALKGRPPENRSRQRSSSEVISPRSRRSTAQPDGLPASEVGAWTEEKHERLRKYVDSSCAARRKYKSRSYIDLYSGPARSWVRETGEFIDGSPLVAFESAARYGAQFTEIIVSDVNHEYAAAAEKRLRSRGANVRVFVGEAASTVDRVVATLDPQRLHFAFLDPYNLGALPFSIIEKLARSSAWTC